MPSIFHRLLVRVRSSRAFLSAELRKLLGMERHDGDFASQRICPFCGLITPRFETCCLECGRMLRPAWCLMEAQSGFGREATSIYKNDQTISTSLCVSLRTLRGAVRQWVTCSSREWNFQGERPPRSWMQFACRAS